MNEHDVPAARCEEHRTPLRAVAHRMLGPLGAADDAVRGADPEHEVPSADSVALALLLVLETLPPPERLAFVLHHLFAVPFDEIAPLVGCTPADTRQLVGRARRRVRGAAPVPDTGGRPADRVRTGGRGAPRSARPE